MGADPGPTPAVVVVGGVGAGTDSGGANGAGVGSVGDVGLVVSVGEGVVVSVVVVTAVCAAASVVYVLTNDGLSIENPENPRLSYV